MDGALVDKIQKDVAAALKDPVVVDYLKKTGSFPVGSTAKEFDAYMHAEAAKWGPVLKAADIKLQ
jgi:tripartite-type tricarboxylate transporter receptor subunit TctC